ncbi:VC0807 family protein [Pseudonocardia sediminis]|uniref:VC0807 family protein n=1 Tax=Pseudonocardia sediminis TaxID=1397368 RepID=UPI001029916A|nr:VC0807 family protein [Pseudonocardia sediminis]
MAPGGRRELVVTVLSDVVAPIVVYYGLRALGVAPTPALLAGAVVPAVRALWSLVRHRRLEWFALLVLVLVAATVATSLVTGSERFLLARDGAITAALGLVMLATAASARPAMYAIGRVVLARSGHDAVAWDGRWSGSARFRRIWRAVTVLWGAGLLVDAVLRVLWAYTLPIDVVPALHAVQWLPLLVVLQVVTQLYLRRPGNRELIFA